MPTLVPTCCDYHIYVKFKQEIIVILQVANIKQTTENDSALGKLLLYLHGSGKVKE
jgi:hypothetical protein